MTIRLLLYVQVAVFVLLLAVALIATMELTRADGGDSLYINLAGRQRMLSQKLMYEALAFAKEPSEERKDTLQFTMALFATSHRALHIGGQTPLNLDGSHPVFVTGASDNELIRLLDQVQSHWKPMKKGLVALMRTSEQRDEALQTLSNKTPELFEHIDASVKYFVLEKAPRNVVNVAARQRLLSQKTAFQAMLIDTAPSEALRSQLHNNMELFETSLHRLRNGGDLPLGREQLSITLRGTDNRKTLRALDNVQASWLSEKAAIATLTAPESPFQQALAQVQDSGPKVLFTMNEAVLRSQRVAEQGLRTLEKIQIGALVVGLIVAIISGFFVSSLGRAFKRLLFITAAISRGDMNERVEPLGVGELRALSRSFERMRFSLKATMDLLENED